MRVNRDSILLIVDGIAAIMQGESIAERPASPSQDGAAIIGAKVVKSACRDIDRVIDAVKVGVGRWIGIEADHHLIDDLRPERHKGTARKTFRRIDLTVPRIGATAFEQPGA